MANPASAERTADAGGHSEGRAASHQPSETSVGVRPLLFVSLVASLGGLLFGFDTAVVSGTLEQVRNQYQLSSLLEGWFTSSALAGCILGAPIGGIAGDRYGRKPMLLLSAVFFFLSALYSMIPGSFSVLLWARCLGGVGVGIASVLAPIFLSEYSPPKLRGRLVATYQLSIVVGILAAYFSNWLLLQVALHPWEWLRANAWLNRVLVEEYWRGMFGAECVPALLFFALLWFVRESPRYVRRNRPSAGPHRPTRGAARFFPGGAGIGGTTPGRGRDPDSWRALFQPGVRRALLVAVMLAVFGQLSGVNIIVYYGPKVLAAAGYATAASLLGQVGFGVINLVFTLIALLFIDRWGRRPLLIGGMAVVTAALASVGGMFYLGVTPGGIAGGQGFSPLLGLGIGVILCVYMGCIAFSICAVIWVLTPEMFPDQIRGRGTAVATFANWATNAMSALVFPWYVQAMGMHAFFLTTAAICATATLFFWWFVPETRGRSLDDTEGLWRP